MLSRANGVGEDRHLDRSSWNFRTQRDDLKAWGLGTPHLPVTLDEKKNKESMAPKCWSKKILMLKLYTLPSDHPKIIQERQLHLCKKPKCTSLYCLWRVTGGWPQVNKAASRERGRVWVKDEPGRQSQDDHWVKQQFLTGAWGQRSDDFRVKVSGKKVVPAKNNDREAGWF